MFCLRVRVIVFQSPYPPLSLIWVTLLFVNKIPGNWWLVRFLVSLRDWCYTLWHACTSITDTICAIPQRLESPGGEGKLRICCSIFYIVLGRLYRVSKVGHVILLDRVQCGLMTPIFPSCATCSSSHTIDMLDFIMVLTFLSNVPFTPSRFGSLSHYPSMASCVSLVCKYCTDQPLCFYSYFSLNSSHNPLYWILLRGLTHPYFGALVLFMYLLIAVAKPIHCFRG